jgi:hypothetical protein
MVGSAPAFQEPAAAMAIKGRRFLQDVGKRLEELAGPATGYLAAIGGLLTKRSRRTAKKSTPAKPEAPRLVLDTNVLVSALLWTGPPHELLRAAHAGTAVLVTSPALMEELHDVLTRPKFAARIAELGTSAGELMESALRRLVAG